MTAMGGLRLKTIDGDMLRDMLLSAASNVERHKAQLNDMNVFPVPDGDTGTNMTGTMNAARDALSGMRGASCAEVAEAVAAALLKAARGNSGVITSLLFRGFARETADCIQLDGVRLAAAMSGGVASAYNAVMKPTEGTILTVSRRAAEEATVRASTENDAPAVLQAALQAARIALDKTPEQLPILKQAGVVDAGGMGYVRILEGMASVLIDGKQIEQIEQEAGATVLNGRSDADARTHIHMAALDPEGTDFGYCTEFMIHRTEGKRLLDATQLRDFLDQIGDSLVFVEDADIVRIHVHSKEPGRVLQQALKYGYLSSIKVENMAEQYGQYVERMKPMERVSTPVEKPMGIVVVTQGEGLSDLFKQLLADVIVEGGQTMNPSIESISDAIEATPADTVFVLPNNKNIVLAAEMAAKMSNKTVYVLNCTTVPEGVSALVAFDDALTAEENAQEMNEAARRVKSGQVTCAVRDSTVSGRKVRKGDYMGLWGSKLICIERNAERAAMSLIAAMVDDNSEFITLFYGADVSETVAEKIEESITKKYEDKCELSFATGGQPLYPYLISVE